MLCPSQGLSYITKLIVHTFEVVAWCTYHKDDPPAPEDSDNREKRTDDIPSWDVEFLKVDQGTLFELILVGLTIFLVFSLSVNCEPNLHD